MALPASFTLPRASGSTCFGRVLPFLEITGTLPTLPGASDLGDFGDLGRSIFEFCDFAFFGSVMVTGFASSIFGLFFGSSSAFGFL